MTRLTRVGRRPAFTLIELLVVMSVVVLLASIAVVVVPDVMNQDRTTDGAASLRQWLMIAKARAARDNLPRGVRLIVGTDATNPAKTDARWVTELQYIESPPPLNPNPTGATDANAPRVDLVYDTDADGTVKAPRKCYLMNLPDDVRDLINADVNSGLPPNISLTALGVQLPVTSALTPVVSPDTRAKTVAPYNYLLTLDPGTPYDVMPGAGTAMAVFQFSVSLSPRQLIGEPTLQMPRNVCIDLGVSKPQKNTDYSISFAPSGHVLYDGNEQIFLWVRDYTKTPDATNFAQGGAQQVVAIKSRSGALGAFPIAWDTSTPTSPFQFAKQAASSP